MSTSPKRLLTVNGVRRSGNHAVIDWLLDRSPTPWAHLNDCDPGIEDPFAAMRQVKVRGVGFWRLKPWAPSLLRYGLGSKPFHRFVRSDSRVRWDVVEATRYELIVASVEDRKVCEYGRFAGSLEDRFGEASAARLMVLRDPFNLFASLLRSGMMTEENADSLRDVWLDHAAHAQEVSVVNYNRWLISDSYRAALLARVGVDGSPEAYERTPAEGGGSSFDGDRSRSALLSRWEGAAAQPLWRRTAGDPRVVEAARQHFDEAAFPGWAEVEDRVAIDASGGAG